MLFRYKLKISSLLQIFTNSCNSVLQRCEYRRTQKGNGGLINLHPRTHAAVTLVFTNSHEMRISVCRGKPHENYFAWKFQNYGYFEE